MKPEEYRLIMRNLELHYQDYMRDSQDSQLFGPDDRMQVEDDYSKVVQHFEGLLRSMEQGNAFLFQFFLPINLTFTVFTVLKKSLNRSVKANNFYPPFRENVYSQR